MIFDFDSKELQKKYEVRIPSTVSKTYTVGTYPECPAYREYMVKLNKL